MEVNQLRNSEMVNILAQDFLPLLDRNVFADFYGATSELILSFAQEASLDTTRVNTETSVFSLSGNEITIGMKGLYAFFVRTAVGLVGGSTPGNVVATWLERDSGSGYAEMSAARIYIAVPTAQYQTGMMVVTDLVEVGTKYRVQHMRIAGSDNCQTPDEGTSLTAVCLYSFK